MGDLKVWRAGKVRDDMCDMYDAVDCMICPSVIDRRPGLCLQRAAEWQLGSERQWHLQYAADLCCLCATHTQHLRSCKQHAL